jgi:Sec-independent protein translocase protein TatA
MFGIGPQELLIVGLLVLLVFGPTKATSVAKDIGRFVSGARSTVEDIKSELLVSEEVDEARRSVEEIKGELALHKKDLDEHVAYGASRASRGSPQAPQRDGSQSITTSNNNVHGRGE